jgi:hypothetical protein
MKLPGGEEAIVEIEKLRDYCLSPVHRRGRHKVRVFLAALGMTDADVEELRAGLMAAAEKVDADDGTSDEYGHRYTIDFELNSANARLLFGVAGLSEAARSFLDSLLVIFSRKKGRARWSFFPK